MHVLHSLSGRLFADNPEYMKCYCTPPDGQGVSACSDSKGATCNVSCNYTGPCSCSLLTAQPDEHGLHLGGPVYLVSIKSKLLSHLRFLADGTSMSSYLPPVAER